jgi:hypothetical protein
MTYTQQKKTTKKKGNVWTYSGCGHVLDDKKKKMEKDW